MASTGEAEQVDAVSTSLGARFETQPNALNFVRLLLAGTVIVWHAYLLAGHTYLPEPARQLLEAVPVDAFFAVSGFLICRAWTRRPDLARFAAARARRILPGLWACLLVTALVIAPLASTGPLSLGGRLWFVVGNAATWNGVEGIDGGPVGVALPGVWNGSLWSLGYEAACYVAVAALGVAGLLRRRVLVVMVVVFWLLSAAMVAAGVPSLFGVLRIPRIGLMFACGALLWAYRDRVRVDGRLAAVAVALVAVGSFTPDYRLVAAPAVAYLAMYASDRLGRHPRLVLTNDLSYGLYVYGFPIQQALLMAGLPHSWLSFTVVSLACVLPAAAASWFLVERPALRRRSQIPARSLPEAALPGPRRGPQAPGRPGKAVAARVLP